MFAQIAESHDLVWIALIGAAQAVFLGFFTFLGVALTYFVARMNKQIDMNTRLTQDTHRMVNGAFGQELDKTASAKEALADVTGKRSDIAAAVVARKVSDDKAANVAAGSPMAVVPEVPPPHP